MDRAAAFGIPRTSSTGTPVAPRQPSMGYLIDRVFSWMTVEPFIGLLMIVATIVLFIGAYRREAAPPATAWAWIRRLIEAAAVGALFLGLLWSFRALLNDNTATFRQTHGRVSEANYESLKTIWGGPHEQRELSVTHSIEVQQREELPRLDPADPPVYRTVTVRRAVDQNSIQSADGKVDLVLNQRRKGSAVYNGFELAFEMTYVVTNASPYTTDARFAFPISTDQALFEDLLVLEDGKDISSALRFGYDEITWMRKMTPMQSHTVKVKYRSRGVEHFYYQIPSPREIRNFKLVLDAPDLPREDVNYPEGCLTPNGIEAIAGGKGTRLTWELDRAITTAGMGVALPRPEQPGAQVSRVLGRSPFALMMLIVSIALTFLLRGRKVDFVELALLSALYSLLFLVMASVSDVLLGFWGALVVGAGLTLALCALLYRRETPVVRNLVLGNVAFFTLVYPLVGLLPEARDSFDGLVAAGLIVYLFLLALATRLRS